MKVTVTFYHVPEWETKEAAAAIVKAVNGECVALVERDGNRWEVILEGSEERVRGVWPRLQDVADCKRRCNRWI